MVPTVAEAALVLFSWGVLVQTPKSILPTMTREKVLGQSQFLQVRLSSLIVFRCLLQLPPRKHMKKTSQRQKANITQWLLRRCHAWRVRDMSAPAASIMIWLFETLGDGCISLMAASTNPDCSPDNLTTKRREDDHPLASGNLLKSNGFRACCGWGSAGSASCCPIRWINRGLGWGL